MRGKVNSRREATVRIQVHGAGKRRRSLIAVIDTGFSGSLTLPASTIRALKLTQIANRMCELADGSVVAFDVFQGIVTWHGKKVIIEINQAQTFPLLGMTLLECSELNIRVRQNDSVTIHVLPRNLPTNSKRK